jgi:hypothetical protein
MTASAREAQSNYGVDVVAYGMNAGDFVSAQCQVVSQTRGIGVRDFAGGYFIATGYQFNFHGH